MPEKSKEHLFSPFEATSKAQWISQIERDLKLDSIDKLVQKNDEGTFYPLYTIEDVVELSALENYHHAVLNEEIPALGVRHWENRVAIIVNNEKNANQEALNALAAGAEGIVFKISHLDKPSLPLLLNSILLEYCSVSFEINTRQIGLFAEFLTYIKESKLDPSKIQGGIMLDALEKLTLGELKSIDFSLLVSLAAQQELPRFKTLYVSACALHNSGANIPTTLGLTLNKWVEYLHQFTELGIDAQLVINNTAFGVSVGKRYFKEIAQLKALRILAVKIALQYGVAVNASDIVIHAYNSLWTKTRFDKHVNLLRTTTECMSAILGGAQSICLQGFDLFGASKTTLAKRMALNTSTILKEEGHLNKTVDPAAGSYAIEAMTNEIMNNSFDQFLAVEKFGGFLKFFESGQLVSKVVAQRNAQFKNVAQRKDIYVGVNQYANPTEKIAIQQIDDELNTNENKLVPTNAVVQFEQIRMKTEQFVQKKGAENRPQFLLLSKATDAMSKARATFALNFMTCAGFQMSDDIVLSSNEFVKLNSYQTNFVIICGTDEYYAQELVADLPKIKKQLPENAMVILAGLPVNAETLKSLGIDEFIHRNSDILSTLTNFQTQLKIA